MTLAVTVSVMLFVVNWSFQNGFTHYLQQGEINQAEAVAELFSEQFQFEKNWDYMRGNFHIWRATLETAGIPIPPPPSFLSRRPRPDGPPRSPGNYQDSGTPPQYKNTRPPPPPIEYQGSRTPPPYARDNRYPSPNGDQRAPRYSSDIKNTEVMLSRSSGSTKSLKSAPLTMRLALLDASKKAVFIQMPTSDIEHWIPIKLKQKTVGWVGLDPIEVSTDQLASSFIAQQRQSYVLVAIVVLFLSLIVAAIWARQFLSPIHKVAYGAKQVSTGNYDTRVTVKGKDELAQLASDFNKMTETLQRNEMLRRQWISDISHELRTPIAVISGEIEALMDGIREPTPERISSLYSDVYGLGQLVEDLHQLSLSDQGALELVRADIDIFSMVKDILILFTPRMTEKGIKLSLDANPEHNLNVFGDSRRLNQLITNLLENSLRYTDKAGESRIQLTARQQQLVITISDTFPGVPEASLERIFDRLYRVDKSRSRSVGGSGLGLSICKNIVEAHNGEIYAKSNADGGLSITVCLPQKAPKQ